jgi:hypothetical protein
MLQMRLVFAAVVCCWSQPLVLMAVAIAAAGAAAAAAAHHNLQCLVLAALPSQYSHAPSATHKPLNNSYTTPSMHSAMHPPLHCHEHSRAACCAVTPAAASQARPAHEIIYYAHRLTPSGRSCWGSRLRMARWPQMKQPLLT